MKLLVIYLISSATVIKSETLVASNCTNLRLRLECDEDHVIEILNSTFKCQKCQNKYHSCDGAWTESVNKNSSMLIGQRVLCDDFSNCTVDRARFYFKEKLTNFQSITYQCKARDPLHKKVNHCFQQGNKIHLECPNGTTISVPSSVLLSVDHNCYKIQQPHCYGYPSEPEMSKVRENCNGRSSCFVEHSREKCNTSSYNNTSYQSISFYCQQGPGNHVANEQTTHVTNILNCQLSLTQTGLIVGISGFNIIITIFGGAILCTRLRNKTRDTTHQHDLSNPSSPRSQNDDANVYELETLEGGDNNDYAYARGPQPRLPVSLTQEQNDQEADKATYAAVTRKQKMRYNRNDEAEEVFLAENDTYTT